MWILTKVFPQARVQPFRGSAGAQHFACSVPPSLGIADIYGFAWMRRTAAVSKPVVIGERSLREQLPGEGRLYLDPRLPTPHRESPKLQYAEQAEQSRESQYDVAGKLHVTHVS